MKIKIKSFNTAKVVLRRKFIALNAYIKKEDIVETNTIL